MLNTSPRAKLHGLALLAPLTNSLTNFAAKVALVCALAIPTIFNRFAFAFPVVSLADTSIPDGFHFPAVGARK